MRDDRRNYLLVGAFVIAMLAGLLVWLALLSGRTGATDPYYVVFNNVMGLTPGTKVLYEGYPVGRIEEISPADGGGDGRFRVDLRIRRGWRIPRDSAAGVSASTLLSAMMLDIRAGESDEAIEAGGEIPASLSPSLFTVMAEVAGEFGELAEDSLRPLLDSLSEGTPEIITSLESFTDELNQTLGRVNALIAPLEGARVERILGNVESTSANFATVSGDLVQTQQRLDALLESVDALLDNNREELTHAIVDLHDSLESVTRHIDDISRNLAATTRNMNEFSRQLRQNPGVLIRGRSADEEAP